MSGIRFINSGWEMVPVDSLVPHPQNPRRGNIQAIADAIRENGWAGYVVAQRSTRRVLVGNHRLEAAREVGLREVPVVWVDVDDEAAIRIMLADNRVGDLGGYRLNDLVALLEELYGTDGLRGTGYTLNDLVELADAKGDYSSAPLQELAEVAGMVDQVAIRIGELRWIVPKGRFEHWLESLGNDPEGEVVRRLGLA